VEYYKEKIYSPNTSIFTLYFNFLFFSPYFLTINLLGRIYAIFSIIYFQKKSEETFLNKNT